MNATYFYWEHPEVPFDWTRDALERYVERRDWVLLFNALVLTAPAEAAEHGS
jgi:hypothetical protein